MAPGMTRAAVLRDPDTSNGIDQFAAIQSVAPSRGVEVIPINVRDAPAVERAVTTFALSGNGGLIVTASALAQVHRDLIIMLAARYSCPRSTPPAFTSPAAAWFPMGLILSTSTGARRLTSIASSRARRQPI